MELHIKRYNELTRDELYEIMKARIDVFVVEQNCPYPEIDGKDIGAYHVWLSENNEIAAYLRVLDKGVSFEDASLGRVLSTKRRCGLGTAIVKEGIRVAKEMFGAERITIEAQTYVRTMYEKLGFVQVSDEFLEDGIPHIKMTLDMSL
ncbi:MAG: GNAT family N-acetyltransferase [Ruminococcaceae bacterium]|nr:GNAT family N-acetyltransferase [Oscillospiraceae bacterium]